jgi:hypothetical protein
MSLSDDIKDIERSLREAGANLDSVLQAAKVDRSTWTRWKNGSITGARYDTMERVRGAVAAALADAPPRQGHNQTGAAA